MVPDRASEIRGSRYTIYTSLLPAAKGKLFPIIWSASQSSRKSVLLFVSLDSNKDPQPPLTPTLSPAIMSTLAAALGLHATGQDGLPVANYAPYYAIFQFLWAHVLVSPRILKKIYGIDNPTSPREDLARYGEKAVQDGKITRRQLNQLKRNEAAHANSVENYPVFLAAVWYAMVGGVPNGKINRACAVYTLARAAYVAAYLLTERLEYTGFRSLSWWTESFACFYLFWQSGKTLT